MIVTFREIGALNQLLQEKHLDYKIHLSDACGSQSMWIESLNNAGDPKANTALYEVIDAFFEKMGTELEYTWDKKSFWFKDRSLVF